MQQALGVEPAPMTQILGQEGVVVVGDVVGRGGVEAAAAIAGDESVELAGDGILGCLLAELVDVLLDGCTAAGIGGLCQQVVLRGDGVEPGPLAGVVDAADSFITQEIQPTRDQIYVL